MIPPELGGREEGVSNRSQGRDFTPERRSAHVVGFLPPPVTSRVAKDKGHAAPDHGINKGGGKGGQGIQVFARKGLGFRVQQERTGQLQCQWTHLAIEPLL